jgi:hypothetical protein
MKPSTKGNARPTTIRLAAAFLTAATVNCAPPAEHYLVRIEPDLSTEAGPALQEWADHTGVNFDIVDRVADCTVHHCFTVSFVDSQDELTAGALGGECDSFSCTVRNPLDDTSAVRFVRSEFQAKSAATRRWAALHEIGHALALGHRSDYEVMNPHPSQASPSVTCADEAQYFAVRGQTRFCKETLE